MRFQKGSRKIKVTARDILDVLAIVGLLTALPVAARAEGLKVSVLAWQEKAYAEGQDASPVGGRLAASGDFGAFGRSFSGEGRLDVTSLNGQPVDFSRPETLGSHAAFRATISSDIGGNLSVIAFGGFATALDKDPDPLRKFPREYGFGVRYTDRVSGSTFDVTACRSEVTRATFGAGQLCFSGDIPVGIVRFGADAYLDLKNDSAGKDLLRVRAGVSVPDLVKAIF